MKKVYSKPMIVFEDFHLSANIATGCGVPTDHAMMDCGKVNGMQLFTAEYKCAFTPDENGLCYQVSVEANRLFTS